MSNLGPIDRLGRYTATHFRAVMAAWVIVAVGLGVFAPKVEHALSGAGWEASGSESVQARVADFFTFALSGPLPPNEMGVILGVAVLLDAALVRLLLVPVLLRLLSDKARGLPKALRRVLPDVRFGHA